MGGFFEPNAHPALVHFAFALTLTAVAGYWLSALRFAGDWMLAFAAALRKGDAAGVEALLAPDAISAEGHEH